MAPSLRSAVSCCGHHGDIGVESQIQSPRVRLGPRMARFLVPGLSEDLLCCCQASSSSRISSTFGIQTLVPPCSCQAMRLGELRTMEARAAEFHHGVCDLWTEIDTIRSENRPVGDMPCASKRLPADQCCDEAASDFQECIRKEALPLSSESARTRKLRFVQARAAEFYDKYCTLSFNIEAMMSRHSCPSPCPSCSTGISNMDSSDSKDVTIRSGELLGHPLQYNGILKMRTHAEVDRLHRVLTAENLNPCVTPRDIMSGVPWDTGLPEISQARVVFPPTTCCEEE